MGPTGNQTVLSTPQAPANSGVGNALLNSIYSGIQQPSANLKSTLTGISQGTQNIAQSQANTALQQQELAQAQRTAQQVSFMKQADATLEQSKAKNGKFADPNTYNTVAGSASKLGYLNDFYTNSQDYIDPTKGILYNTPGGLGSQAQFNNTKQTIEKTLDQYNNIPDNEKGVWGNASVPNTDIWTDMRNGKWGNAENRLGFLWQGGNTPAGIQKYLTQNAPNSTSYMSQVAGLAGPHGWQDLMPEPTDSSEEVQSKIKNINAKLQGMYPGMKGLDSQYLSTNNSSSNTLQSAGQGSGGGNRQSSNNQPPTNQGGGNFMSNLSSSAMNTLQGAENSIMNGGINFFSPGQTTFAPNQMAQQESAAVNAPIQEAQSFGKTAGIVSPKGQVAQNIGQVGQNLAQNWYQNPIGNAVNVASVLPFLGALKGGEALPLGETPPTAETAGEAVGKGSGDITKASIKAAPTENTLPVQAAQNGPVKIAPEDINNARTGTKVKFDQRTSQGNTRPLGGVNNTVNQNPQTMSPFELNPNAERYVQTNSNPKIDAEASTPEGKALTKSGLLNDILKSVVPKMKGGMRNAGENIEKAAGQGGNINYWKTIAEDARGIVADKGQSTRDSLEELLKEEAPAQQTNVQNPAITSSRALDLRKGLGSQIPNKFFKGMEGKLADILGNKNYNAKMEAKMALRTATSRALKEVAPDIRTPDALYSFYSKIGGDIPTWGKRIALGYATDQVAKNLPGFLRSAADIAPSALMDFLGL